MGKCKKALRRIILRYLSICLRVIPCCRLCTVSSSRQPPRVKALYSMRKLPYKFSSLAFAFYMATIIAFMMCLLLTAINTGIDARFIQRVLGTYVIAMPVAFACVILVRPLVLYLVSKTVATKTGDI